ncbi:MAG: FtsW/RodA/SpoVE family cell cycle protein [Bacteroidales bacterium]|nr:FtsW/RodA/SpoVE family cell cycle protein [Bacteroidales bacterium]
MENIRNRINGDIVIWIVVLVLSVFSILSVYSSSGSVSSSWSQVSKHLLIVIFSFGIIYLIHIIPYTYFSRLSVIAIILCIPLIILTLWIGKDINDAKRSIEVPGLGISIQTFDFVKLAIIMYVARILSKNQDNPSDFKKCLRPIIISTGIICLMIFRANFSTAALIFLTVYILLFIGRVKILYLLSTAGAIVLLLVILLQINKKVEILPRSSTWDTRWKSYITPDPEIDASEITSRSIFDDSHFAKMAISNGGFFGVLPGNSIQRNVLSNAPSDFIFAIIVEEYGIIGGVFIILCYMIIFLRAIRIANKTPRFFGALIVLGCALILVVQAIINIAYTVSLLPMTGLTLPFISLGGMSLWFSAISIGIILSVSRDINEQKVKENHASV